LPVSKEDRISRLKQAASQKSEDAYTRSAQAITRLLTAGRQINFSTVAEAASVSRPYLYGHEALRQRILDLRKTPPGPSVGAASVRQNRASDDSIRVKLEVVKTALDELKAENAALRSENRRLVAEVLDLRRSTRTARGRSANQNSGLSEQRSGGDQA